MANSSHDLTNEELLLQVTVALILLQVLVQFLPLVKVCTDTASGTSTVAKVYTDIASGTTVTDKVCIN